MMHYDNISRHLTSETESSHSVAASVGKTTIVGGYTGGHYQGTYHSVAEGLSRLASCRNVTELEHWLRGSAGKFVLFVQSENDQLLYSSVAGPGCFYERVANTYRLFFSEKEAYTACLSNGLDTMETLHFLTSKFSYRSPFSTLILNCKRLIGARCLNLVTGAETTYIGKRFTNTLSIREDDLLPTFGATLESCVRSAFDNNPYEASVVQFSGGIDSVCTMAAVEKTNQDYVPIHFQKTDQLNKFAANIASSITDKALQFIDVSLPVNADEEAWRQSLEQVRNYYSEGLGILGFRNIFLSPTYLKGGFQSVGGHSVGVVYQGHPAMFPAFNMTKLQRIVHDWKFSKRKRYLYTREFIAAACRGKANRYSSMYGGEKLPESGEEYLANLTINRKFPLGVEQVLPQRLSEFESAYREWRYDSVIGGVLGADAQLYDVNDPNDVAILMRLVRYAVNVQSATLNMTNYNAVGDYHQIDPPVDGPMISMLLEKDLSMSNVFKPKHLEFMYFEEYAGKKYYNDLIHPHNSLLEKIVRKWSGKRKHTSSLAPSRGQIQSLPVVKQFINGVVGSSPIFLDMIASETLRDYAYKRVIEMSEGKTPEYEINQYLNLELFLRACS